MRAAVAAESVTQLGGVAGKVLVAGPHGGIIAALLGAQAGAHALILNDAGEGLERAGLAGLTYLEDIGMAAAAAAADCRSARIGDGRSMWESGRISFVNAAASRAGGAAGQTVRRFVEAMRAWRGPR